MKKVLDIIAFITVNAPKIKYYAEIVIHAIDMLDGVKDFATQNKPETKPEKKK